MAEQVESKTPLEALQTAIAPDCDLTEELKQDLAQALFRDESTIRNCILFSGSLVNGRMKEAAEACAVAYHEEGLLPAAGFTAVKYTDLVAGGLSAIEKNVQELLASAEAGVVLFDANMPLMGPAGNNPLNMRLVHALAQAIPTRKDVVLVFSGLPSVVQGLVDIDEGLKLRIGPCVDFNAVAATRPSEEVLEARRQHERARTSQKRLRRQAPALRL